LATARVAYAKTLPATAVTPQQTANLGRPGVKVTAAIGPSLSPLELPTW